MRSALLAIAAAGLFAGCSSGHPRTAAGEGNADGPPIVTGWVEPAELLRGPAHLRFKERYDTVRVEENLVGMLAQLSGGVEVLVYYGSWCSDSRREVPRFLRIMEKGAFPGNRIRFYALDRTKKSPDGLSETYGIELVPTFLFFRGGREIGRIVELPKTTLEGDIIEILIAARSGGG